MCVCVCANVISVGIRVLSVEKIAWFIQLQEIVLATFYKIRYFTRISPRFPVWLTSCLFAILLKALLRIRTITNIIAIFSHMLN